MAERLKDELDIKLASLFGSEPVRDDGFSARVVSRVRRQMWVRRLSLPFAFAIGAAISAKPLLQIVTALPKMLSSVPSIAPDLSALPIASLPQTSTIVWGALLLASVLMVGRVLED